MSLIVEPWWLVLLCVVAGLVYAGLLYYREKKLLEFKRSFIYLLAFLRFLVIFLVAFFLCDPLIRYVTRDTEKPLIIVAIDNSASVRMNKDSAFYNKEFSGKVSALLEDISSKFDTATFTFGENVKSGHTLSFSDKLTDMSGLFKELNDRFSHRNIGAVIIASDGLYNKGTNPLYSSLGLKCPVMTIGLGDTTERRDLILKDVAHNRYAYLGNTFPFEIVVDARQFKDKKSTLTVSYKGNTVFSQVISINSNSFLLTVPVQLEAKEPGLQRYRVSLTPLEGELSKQNNSRDVFIEILDARQKVLILAHSPHPDVAALRDAISVNQQYEVETSTIDDFNKQFNGYNLVILHQLPGSSTANNRKLNELFNGGTPVWIIVGASTEPAEFNRLNTGVKIPTLKNKTNDAMPSFVEAFTLFTLTDEQEDFFRKLPPLLAPFGTYKTSNAVNALLYQRIGMVKTENPLWLFSDMNGRKAGITAGEGLWRWKLTDYSEHGNNNFFNDLVSKTVQYLSVKADRSQFRINAKTDYLENEPVEFRAEVYNASFELINDPEVNISIISEEGKKYLFVFNKSGSSYYLNAGSLPVGKYTYEANTKVGDKLLVSKGQFSVSAIQLESMITTADHGLLFSLAKGHGGSFVPVADMDKIPGMLENREDVKTISFTQKKLSDLINIKWIFGIILFLFTLEWFLRKRGGAY